MKYVKPGTAHHSNGVSMSMPADPTNIGRVTNWEPPVDRDVKSVFQFREQAAFGMVSPKSFSLTCTVKVH